MAQVRLNCEMADEQVFAPCHLAVSDSSIGPGAWLSLYTDPGDPTTGALILLDAEEAKWVISELGVAVGHALIGEEYEAESKPTHAIAGTPTAPWISSRRTLKKEDAR